MQTTPPFNTTPHPGPPHTPRMSDEPINPKTQAEESCKPKCIKTWEIYEQCAERIEGKKGAHCQGPYLDYWKCIDQCALPKFWNKIEGR